MVGGDDDGTVNAAVELAAQLPRVWGMNGRALGRSRNRRCDIRAHGVTARSRGVSAVVVDSDRRGVA